VVFFFRIFIRPILSLALKSIRKFHFSNEEADLRTANKILKKLIAEGFQSDLPVNEIRIRGWYSNRSLFSLKVSALRLANPQFAIRIRRFVKKDLLAQRKSFGVFAGFTLLATRVAGSGEMPKFDFFLSGGGFQCSTLQPANTEVGEFSKKILAYRTRATEGLVGYIDDVSVYRQSGELRDKLAYLALVFLVENEIQWVFEFARSRSGRFMCIPTSNLLRDMGRLVDAEKFEFLAGFSGSSFEKQRLVSIKRHYVPEVSKDLAQNPPIKMISAKKDVFVPRQVSGELLAPPRGWLALEGAELLSGCLVLRDGAIECYEYAADPIWDFVSGLWGVQFGSQHRRDAALVPQRSEKQIRLGEAILIGGRADANYYHFLIEYLPRVLEIPDSISREIPIVVSQNVPDSGIEALKLLTERQVILLDPDKQYRFTKIYVASPVAQVLDTSKVPWPDGIFMRTHALEAFRYECLVSADAREELKERIFLKRSSGHRLIKNEKKLEAIAEREGLRVIDVSKLSWVHQVNLFATAELVVGAGGAVMANYLFLPERARVLSLVSLYTSAFTLPAQICAIAGASFTYLIGRPIATKKSKSNFQTLVHSSFRINSRAFRKAIRYEVAEIDRPTIPRE
jgi:capsular polysaccharide biosynthesis protein